MKTALVMAFSLLPIMGSFSCTDQDKIAAAIQDGKEVNEGDQSVIYLYQNYPNPFNSYTTIRFAVADSRQITLRVFTDDWQEVSTLVDEVRTPGFYAVTFNPPNLPSGDYYYTLEAGGLTLIRRMTLVN